MQGNYQLMKNVQMTWLKQNATPKPEVSKPAITPKVVPDAQDKDEIAILVDNDDVTLIEDEIRNLFQDTSEEEELENEWL